MTHLLFSIDMQQSEYFTKWQFLLRSKKTGLTRIRGQRKTLSGVPAHRRRARGLRPVPLPSRGDPALIPDASGSQWACALRLPGLWWGGLLELTRLCRDLHRRVRSTLCVQPPIVPDPGQAVR